MTGQPTDPRIANALHKIVATGLTRTADEVGALFVELTAEIERLQAELAKRTRERDWAVHYEQRYLTRAVRAEKAAALSVPSVREHRDCDHEWRDFKIWPAGTNRKCVKCGARPVRAHPEGAQQ